MAQLNSTQINGTITATQAATDPTGLVRLQEMNAALATKAALAHTHASGDVTDFAAAVMQAIGSWVSQLAGDLQWQALSGVMVRLAAAGGLTDVPGGLAVDPGVVSLVGHQYVAADITDLASAVTDLLLNELEDSSTLQWVPGSGVMAQVLVQDSGGLIAGPGGLAVDFGTGHTQSATGDHTHAQLHDALTLAPSASLTLSLAGQTLSAEVLLEAMGGLLLTSSGLAVDFGPTATQAAPGNHTHDLSTINFGPGGVMQWASEWLGNSSTIGWEAGTGTLVASVNLDPSTGYGHAPLAQSSSGLYVALGSGVAQAAPGNHGHSTATEDAAGYMSALDKQALDALNAAPELTFASPLQLASGVVSLPPATHFMPGYLSAADKIKLDALPDGLAFLAPLVADSAGNVSLPAATDTVNGYMTSTQAGYVDSLWAATSPRATESQWGFMDPADKTKLDSLALVESVSAPLALASGVLGLQVAAPLGITAGQIVLSVAAPLTVDPSSGTLGLGLIGSVLEFTAGLTPAILLDPLWGLQVDSTPSFNLTYSGGPVLNLTQAGLLTLQTGGALAIGATQVVGVQQAAVANANDSSDIVTQFNSLLNALRTHGLIASS